MTGYTKSQQIMLEDGCPEFLIRTPEREAALRENWVKNPPKPMPIFSSTVPRAVEPAEPPSAETVQKKLIESNKFKVRIGRAAQKKTYVPGAIWDTRKSTWIHPALERQKKVEDIMAKMSGQKTVAELTAEYNEWAAANGKKPVKKFKDRATALSRIAKTKGEKVGAPPKDASSINGADVVNMFKFKEGHPRRQLVVLLLENLGRQLTRKQLGSLEKYVPAVIWRIDQSKLPYSLSVVKDAKEGKTYGLYEREILAK